MSLKEKIFAKNKSDESLVPVLKLNVEFRFC